jgi:hypothetical protein
MVQATPPLARRGGRESCFIEEVNKPPSQKQLKTKAKNYPVHRTHGRADDVSPAATTQRATKGFSAQI